MQFLKTLFWMVVAVFVAVFATRNWRDVTIDLWGPLAADIKLPLLMGLMLLLGWLPTWLVLRGKLWQARRKLAALDRPVIAPHAGPLVVEPVGVEPLTPEPVAVEPVTPGSAI